MPSFKNSTAGVVVSNETTTYVPLNFDNDLEAKPSQSFDFVESQKASSKESFEIDSRIAQSIGLTEAKNREEQKKFDAEVMRYVQKIKDGAYEEAYKKGLEEGIQAAKEAAYKEAESEMQVKIKAVAEIAQALAIGRERMYEINEKEIIQFCYMMAEKIVFRELKREPSLILSAIKTVAVHQEEITVKVSSADHLYLQPYMEQLAAEMNLTKVRFEKDANLNIGDIVVESEQGIVDGTLETRLKKMKTLLDGQE